MSKLLGEVRLDGGKSIVYPGTELADILFDRLELLGVICLGLFHLCHTGLKSLDIWRRSYRRQASESRGNGCRDNGPSLRPRVFKLQRILCGRLYLTLQECLGGLRSNQAGESLDWPGRLFLMKNGDEGTLYFDMLLRGRLSSHECPVDAVLGGV